MSKKMMKRSLALGALMAFVITGSAWAETSYDNTFDYKVTESVVVNENVSNRYSCGIEVDNKNFSNRGTVDASGSSVIYRNSSNQGFLNEGTIIANVVDIYDNYQGATLSGTVNAADEFIWRGAGSATYLKAMLTTPWLKIIADNVNGKYGIPSYDSAGLMVTDGKHLQNVGNILLLSNTNEAWLRFREGEKIDYAGTITMQSNAEKSSYIKVENNTEVNLNKVVLENQSNGTIQFAYAGVDTNKRLSSLNVDTIDIKEGASLVSNFYVESNDDKNNVVGKSTVLTLGTVNVAEDGSFKAKLDQSYDMPDMSIKGDITMNLSEGAVVDFGATEEEKERGDKIFVNASSMTINTADGSAKVYLSDAALKIENEDALKNEDITVKSTVDLEEIKDVVRRTNDFQGANDKAEDYAAEGVKLVKTDNVFDSDNGVVGVKDNGESYVIRTGTSKNPDTYGVTENNALNLITWRAEMNDMNKRMGELRNANGEHGVWVRMVRGEDEYESINHQYNQYQLGYDEKLSVAPSWTVGVALSYTEGDSTYSTGSAENKHKGLSIYGSKLNEDGTFVDLIAKYARLENDFKNTWGTGDYSTNGYSVSAEFGKRIKQGGGVWVEPQVELTYGKVSAADYKINTIDIAQDGIESLVGRVGFSLGKDIKQGNVYARASYLYDFDGETKSTFVDTASVSSKPRTMKDDLGGGWWEVGLGTNINLSKATYIYADIEKTFGGEVDTNWQWNLGVRYSF